MRLDRGTNGDLRQSALWGKPSKGETRSSALWGKPGRGFVSLVVVALALTASTAASASSRYAYTTPGLVTSAKANPSQTFNVIIQGDADKTTGAIASVVKNELKSGEAGRAKGMKRQFASVNGVAANLTGAQILHLVSKNGIAAITTDSPVQLAGSFFVNRSVKCDHAAENRNRIAGFGFAERIRQRGFRQGHAARVVVLDRDGCGIGEFQDRA